MLRSAETGIQNASEGETEIEGRISISVTSMLASGIVSEVLEEFLMTHPKIQIEVGFQTAQMHPLHDNIDLTIGPELITNESVSHRILKGRGAGFYSNPDLAERIERVDVSDIMRKIPLLMSYGFNWREWSEVFSSKSPAWQNIERFRMKCDDIPMIHRLCVAGVGLAVLPHAMVIDDVENGRLVPVLQQFSPGRTKFYALWGTRSPQVRLIEEFVDHLERRLIDACLAFDQRQ